jgi:hypothetical protein
MTATEGPVSRLGKMVAVGLRDTAIDAVQKLFQGHPMAPGLRDLQSEIDKLSDKDRELLKRVVLYAIDTGIHGLLLRLKEAYYLEKDVDLTIGGQSVLKDGESLEVEPFGEDGWFSRFSRHGQEPECY